MLKFLIYLIFSFIKLQQTLEAAQQQEAQYKSQMETMNSVRHLQDRLHDAQQTEYQFKQMEVTGLFC